MGTDIYNTFTVGTKHCLNTIRREKTSRAVTNKFNPLNFNFKYMLSQMQKISYVTLSILKKCRIIPSEKYLYPAQNKFIYIPNLNWDSLVRISHHKSHNTLNINTVNLLHIFYINDKTNECEIIYLVNLY